MTAYICVEGGEGSYKSTTVAAMEQYYTQLGLRVLTTKEPGTAHLPTTMKLRELMLSNEYTHDMTVMSRELISQAIRSIHMKKLIEPAMASGRYDVIIQDRGVLSGIIYAMACGVDIDCLVGLQTMIWADAPVMYDNVITLINNNDGLSIAQGAKVEFKTGDAMESMGVKFHEIVNSDFEYITKNPLALRDLGFKKFSQDFHTVGVTGKSTRDIVSTIADIVKL